MTLVFKNILDTKCKAYYTSKVKYALLCLRKFLFYIFEKAGKVMQNRIQEMRKSMRVTQNELADAVNVSRQTIISLENGRYNASLALAHKIAKYFGVTIEELFIFDEEDE